MSKKKNLMDGYFDQFKDSVADINPHVAAMVDAIIQSSPTPSSKTEVKNDDVSALKERRHNVEISQPERRNKGGQNEARTKPERSQQPGHKAVHELSSSSRDLNFKESTTTQDVDNFSNIDVGLVQHLGVTPSVLARCIELYPGLQFEQLESLVMRFAEFMKDPKNKVQNARGFFISLAEQASKGQVPLDHIETPDERLMRLFIERQKEAKSQKVDAERAAQEFECEDWLEALTPEMQLSFVPETPFLKAGTPAHVAMLKNHFVENLWQDLREQILRGET